MLSIFFLPRISDKIVWRYFKQFIKQFRFFQKNFTRYGDLPPEHLLSCLSLVWTPDITEDISSWATLIENVPPIWIEFLLDTYTSKNIATFEIEIYKDTASTDFCCLQGGNVCRWKCGSIVHCVHSVHCPVSATIKLIAAQCLPCLLSPLLGWGVLSELAQVLACPLHYRVVNKILRKFSQNS